MDHEPEALMPLIEHAHIELRERLECSSYFRMFYIEINDLHTLTL